MYCPRREILLFVEVSSARARMIFESMIGFKIDIAVFRAFLVGVD